LKKSTVQRTAWRGPFLTVARAREYIAMYKNSYSNITKPKKNNKVSLNKRPELIEIRDPFF